ncbi:hypothetical protein [Nocardioides coralli]|uniref:hypothetical protein n=1 Tax=Nocardioides coralli TaxID=2872154 RepID=UPI001CA3B443|nr:hypothetical protein [Nocardioides coralli]QZY28901.1 hypothetical protein K6T13_15865 [Nocardioides coralli]
MSAPSYDAALAELATRLLRAAEVLVSVSRLPGDDFEGRAAEAFRRRAVSSAHAAVDAAGVVADLAGLGDPSSQTGPGSREQTPVLPPGARGGGPAPPPRPRRRLRLGGVTDELT